MVVSIGRTLFSIGIGRYVCTPWQLCMSDTNTATVVNVLILQGSLGAFGWSFQRSCK